MADLRPTDRTRVSRLPERAVYDRDVIDRILDEALVAHVGFEAGGAPAVVPTALWRNGDSLYIHGASKSRMLVALRAGAPCCVCVTLLDGLVLARSAFHQSLNYRSVVIYGRAVEVTDAAEKVAALKAFTEKIAPGRWDAIRAPNAQELKATVVLRLPIDEASAKVRSGPPVDDAADYDLPVWAGVIPVGLEAGAAVPDPRLSASAPAPERHHFTAGDGAR